MDVPVVSYDEFSNTCAAESSEASRTRVIAVRSVQFCRVCDETFILLQAQTETHRGMISRVRRNIFLKRSSIERWIEICGYEALM